MKKALARVVRIVSAKELLFYKVIFCLVAVFILFLLFDWSKTSMHQEYVSFNTRGRGDFGFIDAALKNGTKLVAGDFLRGLEVLSFESRAPRVRFISNLLLLLNVKLRVWLWNYLPPHPSFSLTWIFSLLLSPIFLYRLIYNLTLDRRAAWIGLSLYLISFGFLSGILFLFHPGKPLTNFFAILGFYFCSQIVPYARQERRFRRRIVRASLLISSRLSSPVALGKNWFQRARLSFAGASRLEEYERRRGGYSRKVWGAFLAVLAVICLGFFTDETAWFLFFIVPVLFPGVFRIKGKGASFALFYIALGCAFILFLTFGAPPLLRMYGFDGFNFWKWVTSPDTSPKAGRFTLKNVAVQGYNFLTEHVAVFRGGSPFVRPSRSCLSHLALLGYFGFLFMGLPANKRRLCLRILLVLAVFLVCQTALLSRHLVVTSSSWYYGALFPVFFSLLCAVLLSCRRGWLSLLNKIAFLILLGVSASYALHPHSGNRGLSYPAALAAWKVRGDETDLFRVRSWYFQRTGHSDWLFLELKRADVPDKNRKGVVGLLEKVAFCLGNKRSSDNLLYLPGVSLTADSFNLPHENVHSLVDDDSLTFWHVALDKLGRPTWVEVDFGKGNAKKVRRLTATPRHDHLEQFFRRAGLLGRNDSEEWEKIADIMQATLPEDNETITWEFDNRRAFRYYRLLINDGYGGAGKNFASMAELGLYE